ncbi:sulfotransferase [Geotalea uraniireducens Rf4]|uniref:Sulfotransferase n=2 Tax=Geotalea uraniireducens TaxID=351604 RepID=A5G845_GEOUR|nr:sulfotransferase [Geotalea uraniireducens Rf4]
MTGNDHGVGKIIVVEYPKSGGTWLVSMLAHSLNLPRRDIYISENIAENGYDASKHPWYTDASSLGLPDSCIIKSHDFPDSARHRIPAKFVHLIRDGRDVIVSKYFFEKDFCVKNGIIDDFNIPFDDYVDMVSKEWSAFVESWLETDTVAFKYEELIVDAFSVLKDIYGHINVSQDDDSIIKGVNAFTKENMKKELGKAYKHNTFVRKGVVGDWRNYFTDRHVDVFKKNAGELLISLEYEENNKW